MFLAFGALALTSCSNKPEGPVVVGTYVWPGFEPGHLAEQQDLYGEADVSLRHFLSGGEVLRAFRNRTIDVATLTLDEALLLQQNGVDVDILLVTDVSHGGDAIMARKPIKSMNDLAGKRVGVEDSALGEYVLGRALQINALQESDIITVNVTVEDMLRLFRNGELDAVVTYEPFKTRLLEVGAVKVFDSKQIPNEIVSVLVVRKDFAEANPNALKAVAKGWLKAAELIRAGQPEAIRVTALRLGVDDQELRDALREIKIQLLPENHTMLSGRDGQIGQASLKIIPVLEKRNNIKFGFRPEKIITAKFLPEDTGR